MDIMKMMKQAKDLQGKMATMQEEIAQIEVEGAAGAGLLLAFPLFGGVRALRYLLGFRPRSVP